MITEFASPAVSEYLVGQGLVGIDRARLNESAIMRRSSLMKEWWGKDMSYKLFLMLKSPVIMKMLLMFISVSVMILGLAQVAT